jgi:hypothetical protein
MIQLSKLLFAKKNRRKFIEREEKDWHEAIVRTLAMDLEFGTRLSVSERRMFLQYRVMSYYFVENREFGDDAKNAAESYLGYLKLFYNEGKCTIIGKDELWGGVNSFFNKVRPLFEQQNKKFGGEYPLNIEQVIND